MIFVIEVVIIVFFSCDCNVCSNSKFFLLCFGFSCCCFLFVFIYIRRLMLLFLYNLFWFSPVFRNLLLHDLRLYYLLFDHFPSPSSFFFCAGSTFHSIYVYVYSLCNMDVWFMYFAIVDLSYFARARLH